MTSSLRRDKNKVVRPNRHDWPLNIMQTCEDFGGTQRKRTWHDSFRKKYTALFPFLYIIWTETDILLCFENK